MWRKPWVWEWRTELWTHWVSSFVKEVVNFYNVESGNYLLFTKGFDSMTKIALKVFMIAKILWKLSPSEYTRLLFAQWQENLGISFSLKVPRLLWGQLSDNISVRSSMPGFIPWIHAVKWGFFSLPLKAVVKARRVSLVEHWGSSRHVVHPQHTQLLKNVEDKEGLCETKVYVRVYALK